MKQRKPGARVLGNPRVVKRPKPGECGPTTPVSRAEAAWTLSLKPPSVMTGLGERRKTGIRKCLGHIHMSGLEEHWASF